MTDAERLARSIEAARLRRDWGDETIGALSIGVFVRPHALFSVGNFAVAFFFNGGGQRCEVAGYSTKLRCMVPWALRCKRLIVPYARHDFEGNQYRNRVAFRLLLVTPLGQLADRRLVDPEVSAATLKAFRATYSASPGGLEQPGVTKGGGG